MDEKAKQRAAAFFTQMNSPVRFRLFLLKHLPSAYFSGVKIASVSPDSATVTIPYKWFTRNPFRSTYFACLSMAAEMSTGILALAHLHQRQPPVALIVVAVEGKFYKKATGLTRFICQEGGTLHNTIEDSVATGESRMARVLSSGYNEAGELIAEFHITWSFKPRSNR